LKHRKREKKRQKKEGNKEKSATHVLANSDSQKSCIMLEKLTTA